MLSCKKLQTKHWLLIFCVFVTECTPRHRKFGRGRWRNENMLRSKMLLAAQSARTKNTRTLALGHQTHLLTAAAWTLTATTTISLRVPRALPFPWGFREMALPWRPCTLRLTSLAMDAQQVQTGRRDCIFIAFVFLSVHTNQVCSIMSVQCNNPFHLQHTYEQQYKTLIVVILVHAHTVFYCCVLPQDRQAQSTDHVEQQHKPFTNPPSDRI